MDHIKEFTKTIYPLSKEALELFKSLFTRREFKKNDIFIEQGTVSTKIYIISSGITRSYFLDEVGKFHTRSIYVPNTMLGSPSSSFSNLPSKISCQCLTDCVLLETDMKDFKKIIEANIELSLLYTKLLEDRILFLQEKIIVLSSFDATKSYIELRKKIPDIDNLIPQYQIASYLNITPVQLSRVRKELFSN